MDLQPRIIFENDDVLVLDKPAGLVVHADGRNNEPTLTDWLVAHYPEIKGVGEPMVLSVPESRIKNKELKNQENPKDFPGDLKPNTYNLQPITIDRPGIVHRLDKETSGVLIVAKNQDAHAFLKEQFQNRTTEKTYLAVVWGNIKEDEGVIDAPIGKSKNDFRKWQAGEKARGTMREAKTEFKVLKRIQENGEYFCLCEVKPKTGRTHQIRVHMKYIHHPLVGDSLYAENRPYALGFSRLALHALSLKIQLPDGSFHEFRSEIPEAFARLAK